jgi:hypothetical protein
MGLSKKQVFHSKVGLEIFLPLCLVHGSVLFLLARDGIWIGFGFFAALSLCLGYVLFSIRYIIDGNRLLIRGGFFYRMEIDIQSIQRITKSRNPLSSPAASLDRLAIGWGHGDEMLVSPKDKIGFVQALQTINPNIQVHWE